MAAGFVCLPETAPESMNEHDQRLPEPSPPPRVKHRSRRRPQPPPDRQPPRHRQRAPPPATYLSRPVPSKEETTRRRHKAPRTDSQTTPTPPSPQHPRRGTPTSPPPLHRTLARGSKDGRDQKRRPRSLAGIATSGSTPHPIYRPDDQIRGSPSLPPPQRTEKGGGTHGGAGETGEDRNPRSRSPLSTVARGRG